MLSLLLQLSWRAGALLCSVYACNDARCLAAAIDAIKMLRNELIFTRVHAFIAPQSRWAAASLACLLVSQAASLATNALAHVAGSRYDEYPRKPRAGILRRRLLERLPSAKHSARCWDHNHRWIMPHVAAYGILAVQALFFFLGGIRQRSNHHALIGRLLYAQVSATTS